MSVLRLAVTQRIVEAPTYHERRDALAHDWHSWARETVPGSVLLPVPNDPDGVQTWLEEIEPDCLVLTGGDDLGAYSRRDDTEASALDWATVRGVPVFGVCRGLQMINVHFGGTVVEDLRARSAVPHVAAGHAVELMGDWASLHVDAARLETNSYHEQGVMEDGVAQGLRAFARTRDGCVEGLHHLTLPVLAVQWHPERLGPSGVFDRHVVRRFFEEGAFWR